MRTIKNLDKYPFTSSSDMFGDESIVVKDLKELAVERILGYKEETKICICKKRSALFTVCFPCHGRDHRIEELEELFNLD